MEGGEGEGVLKRAKGPKFKGPNGDEIPGRIERTRRARRRRSFAEEGGEEENLECGVGSSEEEFVLGFLADC